MGDDERDLKAMFEEAAGSSQSVDGALAAVRPRIRRAHQRRAVARGGAGVLGLLVFGGLIARTGRAAPDGQKVASTGQVSLTDATASTEATSVAATTVTTPTSAVLAPAPSAPPQTSAPAMTATEPPATSAAASSMSPVVTLPVNPTSASAPPATVLTTISPDASTTSVVPATTTTSATSTSSQTVTFDSKGGSLTISYTPSAMTVVSITPAPGWAVTESSVQPDEIEVQFENGSDDSKIHLRLVNGSPQLASGDHPASNAGVTDN